QIVDLELVDRIDRHDFIVVRRAICRAMRQVILQVILNVTSNATSKITSNATLPAPTRRTSLLVLLPTLLRARRKVARRRPITDRRAGNDRRGAHHIEHARDEAEQKKDNEPPGRDTEQPVDQPADAGTDQHASNEFAREPKAPGVARCSRRPISTSIFGR